MAQEKKDLETVGWDDIPSTRPHIPDGNYTVRMIDVALLENKNAGGYRIGYTAIVQNGTHAGFRVPFNAIFLSPDSLWRFKKIVKALKLKLPKVGSVLDAAREAVPLLEGQVVQAKIKKTTAQSKGSDGKYVENPEDGFVNSVADILGPSSGL